MITLKFGGTSMGSASWIINSANIIINRAKTDRTSVVVSAVAGVSNLLQESILTCCTEDRSVEYGKSLKKIHGDICKGIQKQCTDFDAKKVLNSLSPMFDEYERLLKAIVSFGECPTSIHCRIMGMGELLSAPVIVAHR